MMGEKPWCYRQLSISRSALSNGEPQWISPTGAHSGGCDGIHQVRLLSKHPQDRVSGRFDSDQVPHHVLKEGFDRRTTAGSDLFNALKSLVVQI